MVDVESLDSRIVSKLIRVMIKTNYRLRERLEDLHEFESDHNQHVRNAIAKLFGYLVGSQYYCKLDIDTFFTHDEKDTLRRYYEGRCKVMTSLVSAYSSQRQLLESLLLAQ